MRIKGITVNKRFRHALHTIAELPSHRRLARIAPFYTRLRVPIIPVALNQQVKPRNVEVEHKTRPHCKFSFMLNLAPFKCLSEYSLNRGLAPKAAITSKRTKPRLTLFDAIRCAPKGLLTGSAIQNNWRPSACLRAVGSILTRRVMEGFATPKAIGVFTENPTARIGAKVISIRIGGRNAKHPPTIRARFGYPITTAYHRAVDSWPTAALIKRKGPPTLATNKRWVLSAPLPHGPCATRSASPSPRRTLCGYKLFSTVGTGVNVLISHGVNLIDRLAFWSEPFRVYQHLGGSLILSRESA